MPRTAFALAVPEGRVDCWRAHAASALGARAGAHRQRLLARGIVREQVWLQRLPGGGSLALVLWDCDSLEVALGESDDLLANDDLLGGTLQPWPPPPGRLVAGSTARSGPAPSALTFAVPLPADGAERLAAWHDDGRPTAEHEDFLRTVGIREEWLWLQEAAGEGAPEPLRTPLAIVHLLCDAPLAALRSLGDSPDPATALLAGLLPAAGIPGPTPPADLVVATHVRRGDRQAPPVGAALRQALAGGERAAFLALLAPDCSLVVARLQGTAAEIRGAQAVAATLLSWLAGLQPGGRPAVRVHGARDEAVLLVAGAAGEGILWCALHGDRVTAVRAVALPAPARDEDSLEPEDEVVGFGGPQPAGGPASA